VPCGRGRCGRGRRTLERFQLPRIVTSARTPAEVMCTTRLGRTGRSACAAAVRAAACAVVLLAAALDAAAAGVPARASAVAAPAANLLVPIMPTLLDCGNAHTARYAPAGTALLSKLCTEDASGTCE